MTTKKQLVFEVAQKSILNSNTLPSHFIVKGNMVSFLRELAMETGLAHHTGDNLVLAERKVELLKIEQAQITKRSRLKKKLNKQGLSDQEIIDEMNEAFPLDDGEKSSQIPVEPIFNQFKIKVTVMPPTKRRLDPPNLYPSVKALIDGLTDASWWKDDNFEHLLEVSFRYGGTSGIKGTWKLVIDFEEIEDYSDYIVSSS